jgi:hypothetical protein
MEKYVTPLAGITFVTAVTPKLALVGIVSLTFDLKFV